MACRSCNLCLPPGTAHIISHPCMSSLPHGPFRNVCVPTVFASMRNSCARVLLIAFATWLVMRQRHIGSTT